MMLLGWERIILWQKSAKLEGGGGLECRGGKSQVPHSLYVTVLWYYTHTHTHTHTHTYIMQVDLISAVKANILRNEEKTHQILNSMSFASR